ncbi:MAG: DUF3667 domain-containing protein [Chitinophagaceae bacterium]|nr:DUF3667 domain-containing protein [Chitinophagaceae bacterium]
MNCNAQVMGTYCHICGQENIEPKESAWHLVTHFFQDITHFDGKFFSTLGLLIRRPGFLSAEYARGRRASYLNPIRMYIFTSAFFFLVFFSFFKVGKESITESSTINDKTLKQVEAMDSATFANFTRNINKGDGKPDIPMTKVGFRNYYDSVIGKIIIDDGVNLKLTPRQYRSKAEYDSLLNSGVKKHNWLEKKLTYKQIELDEKYKGNGKEIFKTLGEVFFHKVPQLLFVSLPLLALLLKLLYIRRKEFYYVSHSIFSIHLYIFIFIAMLVSLGLGKLNQEVNWGLITAVRGILSLAIFFYVYKAMRNFYHQRRAKTILKFLILHILFLITMGILFMVFFFFSVLSI